MTKRVRVVKVICQPVLVADDGESLTEIPVEPLQIEGSHLDRIGEHLREAIAHLEATLNGDSPEGSPPCPS